ncbi:MAG: cardiolipin synthase [Akkermansiaceae bacterium]
MDIRIPSLLALLGLASCSLPDTQLWNDRVAKTPADMPAEVITKVLVHGTVKSIVSNPVSGTRKGISMWWRRSRLLSDSLFKQRILLKSAYIKGADIEQALDLIGLPVPLPGKIDYLVDGHEFFPALYHSIDQAKHRIDTQIFIFDNDDVATRYADRLKERSRDVQCRVLMDRMGSIASWWTAPETPLPKDFRPPSSMPHYLMEGSRVKARVSQNPWLVADHSKLIMIDGEEAYLGGMNIGREYRYEWHDLMVRVRGPVTTELQNHFNRSWRLQGLWGDWSMPFYRKLKADRGAAEAGHYPIRLLRTTPARVEIEEALLTAIRMSRKRIYLQNSYVTSELLLQELLDARARGVEVNFIFPETNDSKLMGTANRGFAATLLNRDCNVYAYPKFTHVKAAIIDNWACVGSANLDGLSLRINGELNIAYSDPEAVEMLRQRIFLKDMRASRKLKRGELKVPPISLGNIIRQQL